MKPDPDFNDWHKALSENFDDNNYGGDASGYFMKKSHEWCERDFGPDTTFDTVVEVGAGTGIHAAYIRHRTATYYMTDASGEMLARARAQAPGYPFKVVYQEEKAQKLSFPDRFCDRLIATHVLEHLLSPHIVLREWARVLKPGGVLSLVLPCDPGLLWRAGRAAMIRGKFNRDHVPYDYWMAREHVNPINNLVAYLDYYFPQKTAHWYPARIPSMDLNLFYICHIRMPRV